MSHPGPPPAALRRVPVGATVREAYAAVSSRPGLLLRAAALPYVLSIVFALLALYAQDNVALALVVMVLGFVPYTLFGVAWHRLTLLGPAAAAPAWVPGWKPRHWRFLGYALALLAIVYLVSLPIGLMAGMMGLGAAEAELTPGQAGSLALLLIGAAIALAYLTMRFSFVFPAVAVDEAYGLAHAWAHTRGQGFRLLWTLIVTGLPVAVLFWALGALLDATLLPEMAAPAGPEGGPTPEAVRRFAAEHAGPILLLQLVAAALNFVLVALLVSAVSIAFRTCTGWVPDTGASGGGGPLAPPAGEA